MATLDITVPDEHVPRIAETARYELVTRFGWNPHNVDLINDAEAVRTWTKKQWQLQVSLYEGRIAGADKQREAYDELQPVPEP